MATITCRDCGAQRHRVPSNTRYCKRCRMLRDIDYWRRQTRNCPGTDCEHAKFAPLDRNDRYCSACNPGLRAHAGPCALAYPEHPHEGRYIHPALPVCATCARDPRQRQRLIAALERGQAQRKSAHAQIKEA